MNPLIKLQVLCNALGWLSSSASPTGSETFIIYEMSTQRCASSESLVVDFYFGELVFFEKVDFNPLSTSGASFVNCRIYCTPLEIVFHDCWIISSDILEFQSMKIYLDNPHITRVLPNIVLA
jgi:hypothetical protein